MQNHTKINKIVQQSKILLVPGHCISGDKGAYSRVLKTTEQEYNAKVANYLKSTYPFDYDVYEHLLNSYGMRQTALANYANLQNFKMVVELHFNMSLSHRAQGSEILYFHKSKNGKKAAETVLSEIVKEFSLPNRGAKPVSFGNGFGFLQKMKATAILIEPFFGDEAGCKIFEDYKRYAECLHRGFSKL